MANEINAVAGQLWGIPMGEVYTAGPGIKIDNVHKVVSVDETVLWEGNGTSATTMNISESISNFERILVTWTNNGYNLTSFAEISGSVLYFGGCVFGFYTSDGNRLQISGGNYTISNNGTTLTANGGNQVYFNNSSTSYGGNGNKNMPLLKIVGINRKSA